MFALFIAFPLAEGTFSPSFEADFWNEAGLDSAYIRRFISNDRCAKDDRWKDACLKALKRGLSYLDDQKELSDQIKNEWEADKANPDFAAWVGKLDNVPTIRSKAMMWGVMANAFVAVFDAHARFIPKGLFSIWLGSSAGEEQGIGVETEVNSVGLVIRRVYGGTPAEAAGLRPNDRLLAINGLQVPGGADALKFSRRLSSSVGTETTLTVDRQGKKLQTILSSGHLTIPEVSGEIVHVLSGKFSVVKLRAFRTGVCAQVEQQVQKAQRRGVDGIILDLRFSPGGRTDEALCVGQLFTGTQNLMQQKFFAQSLLPEELDLRPKMVIANSDVSIVPSGSTKYALEIPLTVLVNSGTSSVAEMLAAGLQDLQRAWLIGEPTFGKGTFQLTTAAHFNSNLLMMHTIFEVRRITGIAIHKRGLTPNFILPFEKSSGQNEPVFLHETDIYPTSVDPLESDLWVETRAASRGRLWRCTDEQGWAGKYSAQWQKHHGFEDYQQAFAMALIRCQPKLQHKNSAVSTQDLK